MKKIVTCLLITLLLAFAPPAMAFENDLPLDKAHFPDSRFRNYLSEKYDTDHDGNIDDSVSITEIEIGRPFVADVSGIEFFKNLRWLKIYSKRLKRLDTSNNEKLESLDIDGQNTNEIYLGDARCLKNVKINCKNLTKFKANPGNAIRDLSVWTSQLTSLDGSLFPNAVEIMLHTGKRLSKMDVSENVHLEILNVKANKINAKKLDLSGSPKLEKLYLIEDEKPRRGIIREINLRGNTQLKAIQIDGTSIRKLDLRRQKKLEQLTLMTNKSLSELSLGKIKEIRYFWVSNSALKKLDCSSLVKCFSLDAVKNQLSEIKLPHHSNAELRLRLTQNKLETIDVSGIPHLWALDVRKNRFKELDLSENRDITFIDITKNPRLKVMYVNSSIYSKKTKKIYSRIDYYDDDNVKFILKNF